jgi:hypothetical protein
MTMDQTTEPVMPRTLVEAHEVLARVRPGRQAPLAEWLAYYQRSAALYAEVAEIDRGHHHESLHWQTTNVNARRRLWLRSLRLMTSEIRGDVEWTSSELL